MATYKQNGDHTDGAHLVVTLSRSGIKAKPKSRGTLRALGLKKIGDTNTLPDRAEIRGMIARVPHLLTIEAREADATSAEAKQAKAKPAKAKPAKAKRATAKRATAKRATAKRATAKPAKAEATSAEETADA